MNTDTFANQVTKLGTYLDKQRNATPIRRPAPNEQELAALFDFDSLARKIVLKPIKAELRNWLEFSGLDQGQEKRVTSWVNERHVKSLLTKARAWEEAFGGAGLILGLDDGQPPEMPLNDKAIRSIQWMRVLDRFRLQIYQTDGSGQPTMYEILPSGDTTSSDYRYVHASRVIQFPGPLTTSLSRTERQGWGVSVYEIVMDRLQDSAGGFGAIGAILTAFAQAVYRVRGLANAIAAGDEEYLKNRIAAIDAARSVLNALILDAEAEDFGIKSTPVTGMAELLDRLMLLVAEAADMPVTLLFGRSPAGMNATGESDMQLWHERIADQQEDSLRPRLERLFRLMFLAKDGPTGGREPAHWEFAFRPVSRPDEQKQAATHLTQAQADAIMLDRGVVTPQEIRDSRFGSGEFSVGTTLAEGGADLLAEMAEMRKALSNDA